MILLRNAREGDLDDLKRISQVPGMFNLSAEKEDLERKIRNSSRSFSGELGRWQEGRYVFVAEEIDTGRVIGTSMIAAQHGTDESPHFFFKVGSVEKFSQAINTGFIHGTLELGYEPDGPSEIGGLVVDRNYRDSDEKLGRQISFVRFLFLAMNRDWFQDRILAELLPPLNKKGRSPLWEAIGRRFTNMDYWEADLLCQKDKEFIFSLFPRGKVYTTFLSAEARNAIGKIGQKTEPVYHMLTKIGFRYENEIDPFDGGPHLRARVDDLTPVHRTREAFFRNELKGEGALQSGLLARGDWRERGEGFRAVAVEAKVMEESLVFGNGFSGNRAGKAREILSLKDGDLVFFMPYY